MEINIPKVRQIIIDFKNMEKYGHQINGDVIFSCMGITKKQTPAPEQYNKIDFYYPVPLAETASASGIA